MARLAVWLPVPLAVAATIEKSLTTDGRSATAVSSDVIVRTPIQISLVNICKSANSWELIGANRFLNIHWRHKDHAKNVRLTSYNRAYASRINKHHGVFVSVAAKL